jgi:hypothetical protein
MRVASGPHLHAGLAAGPAPDRLLDAYEALDAAVVALKRETEPIDTATPVGHFVFQTLGTFAELGCEHFVLRALGR